MRLRHLLATSTVGFGLRLVGLRIVRTSQVVSERGTSWFERTNPLTFRFLRRKTVDMLG
jgi:hypothetical protein